MHTSVKRPIVFGVSIAVSAVGLAGAVVAQESSPGGTGPVIATVAAGLTNPRGFGWAPDGTLHVALAGTGGDTHIAAFPGFTMDIGLTSSIVTVADGCATPVVQGLVSALWEEAGWIWGAMDVAFLGDDAYALLSGAGPSNFSPSSFSGVFRLNGDGTMTLVGDLTSWLPQHPPAFVPPDYGSDGSLFDLEAAGDSLLVSEAVGGQLIRVTPTGEISRVADLSEGHLVPTGIAVDPDGIAYVGFETAAPYGDGASKVVRVTPEGEVTDAWTGLTVVTDVALGPDGVLYAAEMATGFAEGVADLPPDSGRVVRQTGPDSSEAVMTELPYPVHIGFDADDRLVVAAPAFGPDAGVGQGVLVSVDLTQGPVSYAGFEPTSAGCPPASAGGAVAIAGFAFDPDALDVSAGTPVSWTNEDGTQHTVTATDGSFDSGALAQGDTFEHTFDVPGTFDYACRFHPTMKGTIVVG